tara:strand:- start:362 stop:2242 length:1881 start_codon:yes stop_codon:yes gene_type:complete
VSGTTATITTGGGGGGSGTVTSVGTSQAFITITSPTTTPSISIGNASGAATGVLTAANFNTFDAKQDAITLTTTGTSGAATFAGGTLNIPQYSGTTGTVTGNGVANQVSYWTAASVQAGSTGLTYDPSTGDLTVGGYVETGTKVTTPSGTNLELIPGGASSGSIVISDGADGLISIAPNGTGKIKLDGVELDNSAIATGYVLKATSATAAGWAAESGGGGAPTDAEYVTLSANGSLTNERVLTAGTGIGLVDGGAGSTLTIFNSGVTLLTAGTGISLNSSTGGVVITNTVAAGTITGSITDNQIAVGATTANELEGKVKFTYDQATQSLNIAAGTGTGTILSGSSDMVIRNSSGAAHSKITLGHDAANSNIKLDTDGSGLVEIHKEGSLAYSLPNVVTGANDYVLTAQTDGSTAWAASGGGGGGSGLGAVIPDWDGDSFQNGNSAYSVMSLAPYGSHKNVEASFNSSTAECRPFVQPRGGVWQSVNLNVSVASASANKLRVGIYNSSSAGIPTDLLGYADVDTSSTGTIVETSIVPTTGTSVTLVANTQYWLACVSLNSVAFTCSHIDADYLSRFAAGATTASSANGFPVYYITGFATNSLDTNNPPRVTAFGTADYPDIVIAVTP